MGTITSKIADEIRLHGSWEAAQAFNEEQARRWAHTEKPKSLQNKPTVVISVKHSKPPLGIIPAQLWVAQRWRDVDAAIKRYEGTEWGVAPAWIREREWLDKLLNTVIRDYKNGRMFDSENVG